ncbi:MAG: DUF4450 domain-containing protein [Prevotella sp.]|nr:DUF4450 domain-containing protein [Prevotella sp.]
MMKSILTWLLLTASVVAWASEKPARQMQYWPEGRSIVCVNGNNLYSRALYGSHTLFRLETSDRPIFATYDKGNSKNIRLYLTTGGSKIRLDSTTYCKAEYEGGERRYIVKHDAWGKDAELRITALASQHEETALWSFYCTGFKDDVLMEARVCQVAKTKMSREGDLGLEPRSSYEPSADEKDLQTISWDANGYSYLWLLDNKKLIVPYPDDGTKRMVRELKELHELTSAVEFTTPNPFINTLGANLVAAADGLWDGESWLHGCIGWRMPLAGWRAAYVADALGWNDRAISHFNAYAKSQVTNVPPIYPHPSQDEANNLARAEEKWGTQMYSNGYICRYPNRNDKMHHYDMNLNYVDELLWHFCYDADTAYMRKMFPLLKLHLEWEKRNFDPDGDHLYDAYCCIWASDALYYNSGAVTHSSAYNYRGNLLTARIAEIIGEDPTPYREEAEAILKAMNQRLWIEDEGHWAEFQDFMGEKRLHKSAAIWSIYTPIDCGACTDEQAYRATKWVDKYIPHIPVRINEESLNEECRMKNEESLYAENSSSNNSSSSDSSKKDSSFFILHSSFNTISTTNWLPYDWSTNNVAHEEVMNMVLAYFKAGRYDSGYNLLMADLLDGQYLGQCPGNFGQISYYDKARSEAYRDFGDNVGISARAIINGLFGVQPDALNGKCVIQPAFPLEWDSVTFKTPYLSYQYIKDGNKIVFHITQNFTRPLKIIVKTFLGQGNVKVVEGSDEKTQRIEIEVGSDASQVGSDDVRSTSSINPSTSPIGETLPNSSILLPTSNFGLDDIPFAKKRTSVDMSKYFNANVDDIFKNEYLSPRSPYTTLEIPKQGIGQWCLPKRTATIEDDGLRAKVKNGLFDTGLNGLMFATPAEGKNIVYTSLWDNYPNSITIPLKGKAKYANLLLAGSTNNMQSRIDNGIIVATYQDGTTDTLHLENPINWCPIEQEYYVDEFAFRVGPQRPYRVHLGSGVVSRELLNEECRMKNEESSNAEHSSSRISSSKDSSSKDSSFFSLHSSLKNPDSAEPMYIENGAAQILRMPLNEKKKLKEIKLRTLSNDVVIGLMAITLER